MSQPTFTIVIPSYNGGNMLRQCVDSVLAQKYEFYDILVLDDGSDDGSIEWLRGLDDPRIRIEQSPHVGIVANWRRATDFPLREYMTFLGQDDLLDPEFLPVMARQIGLYPDAGLYHAQFRFIDEQASFVRDAAPMPERETAAAYLRALFNNEHETYGTGYIWRTSTYRELGGIPAFPGLLFADDTLWFSLMRGSYKVVAPETCFSCRLHTYSAGRSASWKTWLEALPLYIDFLKREAANDADFSVALRQYGSGYFLGFCTNLYRLALVQATKSGHRLEPGVERRIENALREIAPEVIPEFQAALRSKNMLLRRILNRDFFARGMYNGYALLRHREWRGKHLSGRTAAWRQ